MSSKSYSAVNLIPLSADPPSAIAGDTYYNTGTGKVRVYSGTAWSDLSAATPSNMVTTDTTQSVTGAKTFTQSLQSASADASLGTWLGAASGVAELKLNGNGSHNWSLKNNAGTVQVGVSDGGGLGQAQTVTALQLTSAGLATLIALAMSGLTGASTASRYVGGTTAGAPSSGTFAAGDFVVSTDGDIYVCTAGGSPGTWSMAGIASADVQTFTTVGQFTWTKPTGAKWVEIICIGGGGSGGSGATAATSTTTGGGGGGGGGGLTRMSIRAADLSASYNVTVGGGFPGGNAVAAGAAGSGLIGTTGGASYFGTTGAALAYAAGGVAGGGGTNAVAGTAGAGGTAMFSGGAGSAGAITAQAPNPPSVGFAPSGGGGGGGMNASNTIYGPAYGGILLGVDNATAATPGGAGTSRSVGEPGNGGYGGSGSTTAAGQAGGAGGLYGGGGGGGGAARSTSFASGAGGAGGKGCVVVVSYF